MLTGVDGPTIQRPFKLEGKVHDLYWAATFRGRQRYHDFTETWAKAREESVANTKAVEENTAAVRELIRKWDEQKK